MPIYSPVGYLDITNATLRTSNLEAQNLRINGGNIYVTSELTTNSLLNLENVTNAGNVTSNTVQFSNAITSLTAASNIVVTGNVTAATFIGSGASLTSIPAAQITGTLPNDLVTLGTHTTGNYVTSLIGGDGVTAGAAAEGGTPTVAVDLKANGGLVIESSTIAVDLSASSITGTLAVADGGTGTTTSTGTGSVVLSDAPTLTGTVTAGTFSGSGASLTSIPAAQITGTLAVANGGTGTTTSTGTGNVVLSNAPAFSGDVAFDTNTLFVDSTNNRVGIGTTIPQTSLQIKDETDTTGTGDAFITGLSGNTSNRKPTECLRLQGKYHASGSGALLRFTNQHDSGTNPNTGEYNVAGIAGFDYASAWGGGLCFYTAPTTSNGGDLMARMVIDQAGKVGIGTTSPGTKLDVNGTFSATGPTTGANHGSSSTLYLLDTCFFKEWEYINTVAPTDKVTFNTTTEIPDGAKAVLAEVFLSRDTLGNDAVATGDHQIHVLGKNHTANQTNWRGGAGQPSTGFSAGVDTRQTVELLMPGESDGFTHYFGKWHSSVIIPLENNKIYYSNFGNSNSSGWVYVRIRGYYI